MISTKKKKSKKVNKKSSKLRKELLSIQKRAKNSRNISNEKFLGAFFGGIIYTESDNNGRILNPRTARFREALITIAQKFKSADDFADYYLNGLSRGIYWIGSDKPEFAIGALENEYAKEKKLIAYLHPSMVKTEYAVEVNTSFMNPYLDLDENPKDSTNSIKILRPELIQVNSVTSVPKATRIWEYNSRYLPSSRYELEQFWKAAKEIEVHGRPKIRRRSKKELSKSTQEGLE